MKNEWEERLHKELKKLPEMKAPASLSLRVMAAVAKREKHWRTWAPARQAAFVSGVAAAAAGVLKVGGDAARLLAPRLEAGLAQAAQLQRHLGLALDVVGSVWWAERLPLCSAAAIMYLMCVGFGTLFWQVAARPHHMRA